MNIALWIVQSLLAALFVFGASFRFTMAPAELEALSGMPYAFLAFISICEILGGIGLIVPAVTRIKVGLVPLAAAGLTIIMIGATVLTAIGVGGGTPVLAHVPARHQTADRVRGVRPLQGPPARPGCPPGAGPDGSRGRLTPTAPRQPQRQLGNPAPEPSPICGTRSRGATFPGGTPMSDRAHALAAAFERANERSSPRIEGCSDAQLRAICEGETWPAVVTAHHIALAHQPVAGLALSIANGQPLPPLSFEELDQAERRARQGVRERLSRGDGRILRREGSAAAASVRALTDEQLNRSTAIPFLGGAVWSTADMIENALIGHAKDHGGSILTALGHGAKVTSAA